MKSIFLFLTVVFFNLTSSYSSELKNNIDLVGNALARPLIEYNEEALNNELNSLISTRNNGKNDDIYLEKMFNELSFSDCEMNVNSSNELEEICIKIENERNKNEKEVEKILNSFIIIDCKDKNYSESHYYAYSKLWNNFSYYFSWN